MPIRPTVNLPNRTPVLGLPSTFLFKDLEREINKVLNSETPQKDDAIKELIDAYVSGKEQKGKSKIEQRLKCCLKFLTRKDCVGKVSRDMLKTICSDCNKNKISIGKQKKELANTLSEFCTITQNLMRLNQVKLKVSLKLKVSPSSRLQKERNKKEVLLDKAIKDLKNKSRLKERVVLSYNWKLRSLANYIQQLEMESLGKQANPRSIFQHTGQSVFGGFGSTAQHS